MIYENNIYKYFYEETPSYETAQKYLQEAKSKGYGAAFLVMAIVGGAIMPTLQGVILDFGGPAYDDILIMGVTEVNFSFVLPLVCFVVVGVRCRYLMH